MRGSREPLAGRAGKWRRAPGPDQDGDKLSDALEAKVATEYLPFLSIHPVDKCKTQGRLVRIAPHSREPKRIMMWVDVLFEKDCGANGHAGDDEVFGVVIDPRKPAPAGILAVRAISHQNTPCQRGNFGSAGDVSKDLVDDAFVVDTAACRPARDPLPQEE